MNLLLNSYSVIPLQRDAMNIDTSFALFTVSETRLGMIMDCISCRCHIMSVDFLSIRNRQARPFS